ncbi:MAG: hypothetical protein AAF296_05725 [Pseudomonadota bacterium]
MRQCIVSFAFLLPLSACFYAGGSTENAFKWTDEGLFEISCKLERSGSTNQAFVQSDGGLKAIAGTLCGGDYDLRDYTSNTYTSTGKPFRYDAQIKFSCDPTDAVLSRAEKLSINKVCAGLFEKDAA